MAIFHLTAKVISRGKGHSAVAAAAYRSRACLEDQRTGETCDFRRKAGELLFEGIYAPKDAPAWARDRAQLWNHVEAIEKRRDAQLAREFEIALPHELTLDQQRFAVQDWVRDNFTRKGLIADVVIHAPGQGGDVRNTHAHIMVVMRKLDGSEFAAKKERAADMAERKAELEQLRQSWERTGNRHLERHGHAPTLDRRTLLEQGVERPPTVHLGKEATALERKGVETDLGDLNRTIGTLPVIDLAAERLRRQLRRPKTTRAQALDESTALRADLDETRQETRRMTEPYSETLAVEQARREAALLEEMERQEVARQAFITQKQKEADEARKAEEERRQTAARQEAAHASNGEITDPLSRYAQALAHHYDIARPYQSLARAAMGEYGKFIEQQASLTRDAASETDPQQRKLIELRKAIEGNDYMAITSNRLAGMSEVIAGKLSRPEQAQNAKEQDEERERTQAERDREAAKAYAERAANLRKERAQVQEALAERSKQQDHPAISTGAHLKRSEPVRSEAMPAQARRESEQTSKTKKDDEERAYAARQAHNAAMQGLGPKPTTSNLSADAATAFRESAKEAEVKRLNEEREAKQQQRERQVERGRGGRGGR